MACAGSSNQEIADKLGIQVGVVKNRLKEVFAKLGVWSRLELAMRYRTVVITVFVFGVMSGRLALSA